MPKRSRFLINLNPSKKEVGHQISTNKRLKARARSTFNAIIVKNWVIMPHLVSTIKERRRLKTSVMMKPK